jgi:hypothetical protein
MFMESGFNARNLSLVVERWIMDRSKEWKVTIS